MTASTSTAPIALAPAAEATGRPELLVSKRSTALTQPGQPGPRKLLDAALLQWPLKLRRKGEQESPAEAKASETGRQTRLTDELDPAAIEPALAASEPDLLLAQAAGGSATAAPIDAPADATPTKPAAGPTSIESKLLTPLTQNASWASANWFGAAPTGAAGTGALLTAAALVGGGGGGGGSSGSTTPPADTRAPVLQSAEINHSEGNQLVLTYDENLSNTLPAASAFEVLVDGSRTSVSTVARGTSDLKTVVLTLANPIIRPAAVQVSLSDGSQIRDVAGNVAPTFRDQSVTVTDKIAPNLLASTAITNATESVIVLRYSEPLQSSGRPDTGQFQVRVGGDLQNVTAVQVVGDSIRLSLASKITATNPSVRLSYAVPTEGAKAVQDAAGNLAVAIDTGGGLEVTHNLDLTPPKLTTVQAIDRAAQRIVLGFSEALQADSLPVPSSLRVEVTIAGSTRSIAVASLKLSGTALELTLSEAVSDAKAGLHVVYTRPSSGNTLKDWAGNQVDSFYQPVTTVDAAAPSMVSSRFTSATQLELTFDENLASLGPDRSAWTLTLGDSTTLKPTASTLTGRILTLSFASPILSGQSTTLSYAAPGNDPTALNLALQDGVGNDSGSFSRTLDTTRPSLDSARTSANGRQILLNYSEDLLSPNSSASPAIVAPSPSAFTVLRGQGVAVAVSSVDILGKRVTLNLASALLPDETLSVFYTAPTANIGVGNAAIQDSTGNDALSLGSGVTGQSVANDTLPAVVRLQLDSRGAALDHVVLSLNVVSAGALPDKTAFKVKAGGVEQAIDSISGSGAELIIKLSNPITAAGALTVSYVKPSSNPLKDVRGKEMADFTDQSIGHLITGTTADNTLVGQAGRVDYFLGSAGTDSLEGKGAADQFVWPDFGAGGPGGFTQTIKDFGFKNASGTLQGLAEADLLDLSQLLDGYTGSSTLADFVRAVKGTGDKLNIEIDHNGGGTFAKTATLVFDNVTVNTSNQLVVNTNQFISHNSGNLLLADVITHLMTEGQLAVL